MLDTLSRSEGSTKCGSRYLSSSHQERVRLKFGASQTTRKIDDRGERFKLKRDLEVLISKKRESDEGRIFHSPRYPKAADRTLTVFWLVKVLGLSPLDLQKARGVDLKRNAPSGGVFVF